MSILSQRTTTITFSGDRVETRSLPAANNGSSSGQEDIITLASGNNTITVPGSGTIPTLCSIIPPTANAIAIILKGVAGDVGTRIHNSDPYHMTLDPSVVSFVLNAGAQIIGLRLLWS